MNRLEQLRKNNLTLIKDMLGQITKMNKKETDVIISFCDKYSTLEIKFIIRKSPDYSSFISKTYLISTSLDVTVKYESKSGYYFSYEKLSDIKRQIEIVDLIISKLK